MTSNHDKSIRQALEELTQCPLCLENSKNPICLPCQHWYCSRCLEKHIKSSAQKGKITCPSCRDVHKAKPINDFKAAFVIKSLNEILHKADATEASLTTAQLPRCSQHQEITHLYCDQCEHGLCVFCVLDHDGHAKTTYLQAIETNQQLLKEIKQQMRTYIKMFEERIKLLRKKSKKRIVRNRPPGNLKTLESALLRLKPSYEKIGVLTKNKNPDNTVCIDPYIALLDWIEQIETSNHPEQVSNDNIITVSH